MCDFESNDTQKLGEHIQTVHQQTKFTCNMCPFFFKTSSTLHDHRKAQHKPAYFPCDHCGFKAGSFADLDKHIETYNRIKKPETSERTSDFSNKTACYFRSPQHSSNCCDRDQGRPVKIFSPQERIENGPCRNWNEDFCKFSDLCRFAQIELCRFQDNCRSPDTCRFYHFNHSNITFLGGKSYRKTFQINSQDFPPLHAHNSQRNQRNQ